MTKYAIRFCAFILAATVGLVAHDAFRRESCPTIAVKPVLTIAVDSSQSFGNTYSIFTVYDCEAPLRRTEWTFPTYPPSKSFLFTVTQAHGQTIYCSRCAAADNEW